MARDPVEPGPVVAPTRVEVVRVPVGAQERILDDVLAGVAVEPQAADEREEPTLVTLDDPPEVSEFEEVGLTPLDSQIVKAPRVKESPINMECKLLQVVEVGPAEPGGGFLVIGEIVLFHIKDDLLENGRIDTGLLKPVGRLAGKEYTTLGKRFSLSRKP